MQKAITNAFGTRLSILCPYEAGIAIIKGAVLLGHTPDSVRSRIARKTYGTSVHYRFRKGVHDPKRMVLNPEIGPLCVLFQPWVRKGEEVRENEVRTFTYRPDHATDTHDPLDILCADTEHVKYPDDPSVKTLGILDVWMRDTTGGLNRSHTVNVRFGSSELHISVESQNQVVETKIDFLAQ